MWTWKLEGKNNWSGRNSIAKVMVTADFGCKNEFDRNMYMCSEISPY